MSELLQVLRLSSHLCATVEDQQRFWRRLHRYLMKQKQWWKQNADPIWIDLVYRETDPFSVYMTLPKKVLENFPQYAKARDRKRKGNWSYPTTNADALKVSPKLTICELNLSFDCLFSLPSQPVMFPDRLPLKRGEKARVSFRMIPAKSNFHRGKDRLFQSKMNDGFRPYRSVFNDSDGWRYLFYWLRTVFLKEKQGERGAPFLSRETIRKLNDAHFKVKIRIAAEQQILPKLALPFTKIKGDNEFAIQFLTKGKQYHSLKEMNRQKLSVFRRPDFNPNLLGGRELSYLFPFLSKDTDSTEIVARSSF